MGEQARDAMAKLEKLTQDDTQLAAIRAEIEAATEHAPEPEAAEEVSIEEVESVPEEADTPPTPAPKPGVLDEFVSDLESSLGDNFLPHAPVPQPAPPSHRVPEPQTVEYAEATAEPEHAGALGEFVADLDASLGDSFLPAAPVPRPAPQARPEPAPEPVSAESEIAISGHAAVPSGRGAAAAPAPALEPAAASPTFSYKPTKIRPLAPAAAAARPTFDSGAGVDLADMFGELKHELEEDAATAEEDPETHYNLGVAFREMGLLDEAIGELQKVCQAVDRGHPFAQTMQTYTWLAQCFLDKGVPEAAIRWYERALKLPDMDDDTRMALHYELGSAYETAENKPAALNHFMEVYGSNIDYRDVAERIKALKS
jgi:hypothetical protein